MDAIRDGAHALLIRGEPGIGKSALWRYALEIVAARHVDGQGWGVPRVVASADGASDPCLTVGPDGTAVVAWVSSVAADGSVTRSVQVSRSAPATSWSDPVAVSDTDAAGPSVVLGPDGRALVAWQAIDVQAPIAEAFSIRASRALADGGWAPPELVSTPSGQLATGSPRIVAGTLGTVVAVWATGNEVHARALG